jgi:hypothetical protein
MGRGLTDEVIVAFEYSGLHFICVVEMGDFRVAFVPCEAPPRMPEEPLLRFDVDHWKRHQKYPFIYMGFDADDNADPERRFLCDKCVVPKWRRTSGTSVNIKKHVARAHRGLLVGDPVEEKSDTAVGQTRLLGLLVERNLPFSFVSSPRVRGLFAGCPDRKGMSDFALQMANRVKELIKPEILACSHIVVAMDEWSDAKGRPFLGMKVHGAYLDAGGVKYRAWSIDHVPLEDKTAEGIQDVADQVLRSYSLEDRVTFVVTDTANVMPAAVRRMGKCWWPCWAHIVNLMLQSIVEALREDFLNRVFGVVGNLGRSWKFYKLVGRYEKITVRSIPTFSSTRWYSLARFVDHVLILQNALHEHLVSLGEQPLEDAIFEKLKVFSEVLGTFANAKASLEADTFGTVSRVYDWLSLIETECTRASRGWPAMDTGWRAAAKYRVKYLGPNGVADPSGPGLCISQAVYLNDRVLVCTLLNPASGYLQSLSPGNQQRALGLLNSLFGELTAAASAGDLSEGEPNGSDGVVTGVGGARRCGLTLGDLDVRPQGAPRLSELDRYLALDRAGLICQGESFDLQGWWNANRGIYPRIFDLAVSYLSVPASSAAVERQFSKAKLIQTPNRQSLVDRRLGAMVMLREHVDVFDPVDV